MLAYEEFIANKRAVAPAAGFDVDAASLSPHLFDFQRDIVRWALLRGRAAIFADTGLGKTRMQLVWAQEVHQHTGGAVLILAPLAVAKQTYREGETIGIPVTVCRTQADVASGINITNYEMLHHFNPDAFIAIVLDESSIIKHKDAATRIAILETFARTPYKLACTATPAPNDYTELGNHAEFLGVMTMNEMLSMYFIHDGGETQSWRLKGHAHAAFWQWLAGWGLVVRTPAELGYDGSKYVLPPLHTQQHIVDADHAQLAAQGALMALPASTLEEQRKARRASTERRVALCASLVNASSDPWLIWCDFNAEGDALAKAIPDAVQVAGSDTPEEKERRILAFLDGSARVLISKPSIVGFGLNFQHCAHMAFVGLSYSYEAFYQAVRRCYRFGQKRPVQVHVITSELEGAVLAAIERKADQARTMADGMVAEAGEAMRAALGSTIRDTTTYHPTVKMLLPRWLEGTAG